jgi:hypothetical protein
MPTREPNLNKLSIKLLGDSFTVARDGQVFAVYGELDTLDILRAFLVSLQRDHHGTLWGKPLVVSPKVPRSSIVLGCMASSRRGPLPEDFVDALADALRAHIGEPRARRAVWGTMLRLD